MTVVPKDVSGGRIVGTKKDLAKGKLGSQAGADRDAPRT